MSHELSSCDIQNIMKKLHIAFLVSLTLLSSSALRSEVTAPSKAKMVRAWYGQFRRIRTLRLQTTFTLNDAKNKTTDVYNYKFIFSGGKYRGETTVPSLSVKQIKKGNSASWVGTFDGKIYSKLDISSSGAQLNTGTKPSILNSMGFLPVNVEVLYFNEEKGDFNWILKMQRQEPWQQLIQRIDSVTVGQRNGVDGYWVSLRFRGAKTSLFLNQEFYPLYKKIIVPGQYTSNIEIESKRYVTGGFPIYIPSKVQGVVTDTSGSVIERFTQTLDQPAEINKPIRNASSLFTIPKSQATLIYDTDVQP